MEVVVAQPLESHEIHYYVHIAHTPGPAEYNCRTSVFDQPKPLPAVVLHLKKRGGIPVTLQHYNSQPNLCEGG